MKAAFDVVLQAVRQHEGETRADEASAIIAALTATGHLRTEDRPSNVRAIIAETHRIDETWGEQNHPDGTGDAADVFMAEIYRTICQTEFDRGNGTWKAVLLEEVFEALAESDPGRLRTELVQVAAVVLTWLDAIDRREESVEIAAESRRIEVELADEAEAGAVVAELRARLDTAEQWSETGVTAQAISQAIEIIERVAP